MTDRDNIDTAPTPDDGPAEVDAPALTGQQIALYEALTELDQQRPHKHMRLAETYRGAVMTLGQTNNPDRFAQAAHGVRELMEKLPRVMNVPMVHDSGLSVLAVAISKEWRAYKLSADGPEKDTKLTSFHVTIEEFSVWIENRARNRTEITERLLGQLDPRKADLPGPIKDLHVSVWEVCDKYFQDVSHHRVTTTSEVFAVYLDELERFLLDRLRPRTFDDHAALKAIVAEGETNAEP